MKKKSRLGNADEMFHRFFDRWYDDEDRKLKGFEATRPDVLENPAWKGKSATEICPLDKSTAAKVLKQVNRMVEAACNDWPTFLTIRQPISLNWIEAFDNYYDPARIEKLLKDSDPTDFSNDYLVSVCEFGAMLGHILVEQMPRLEWVPSWPYWETSVFDNKTGNDIPVFHWAIKKFSTYGIDDGFAGKINMCIHLLKK